MSIPKRPSTRVQAGKGSWVGVVLDRCDCGNGTGETWFGGGGLKREKSRKVDGVSPGRKEEPVVVVPHAKPAEWDFRYQRTTSPMSRACNVP